MKNNKKYLITGTSGFLGSNLLKSLLNSSSRDFELIVLIRERSDLSRIKDYFEDLVIINIDEIGLETIFKDNNIETIIHLATDYGRKEKNTLKIVNSNLIWPLELLTLAQKHGVRNFINTDTMLTRDTSNYSLSKKQFLDWLSYYSANLVVINMALEHFYGPFDDKSKFVSFLVEQMVTLQPEIDLTQGEQKRDFVYISDVISAYLIMLGNLSNLPNGMHHFEVGSGNSMKIKELITMVKKLTANNTTQLNFGAIPYRENEKIEVKVDAQKLHKLGWRPKISLEEGLKKMLEIEYNIKNQGYL